MTRHKIPKTSEELLGTIDELLGAVPPVDISDCDRELEAAGFDPKLVGEQIARAATDAMSRSTLNWRVRAQKERTVALQKFEENAQTAVGSPDEMSARITALLAQLSTMPDAPALRAHFHKLSGKATNDELATLLAELEFLRGQLKDTKPE